MAADRGSKSASAAAAECSSFTGSTIQVKALFPGLCSWPSSLIGAREEGATRLNAAPCLPPVKGRLSQPLNSSGWDLIQEACATHPTKRMRKVGIQSCVFHL